MKRHTTFIVIVLFVNVTFSQNIYIPDSTREFILNETYKNIAAFNIKYSQHSLNGIDKNNFIKTNRNFFYDAFIADNDFKFKIQIQQLKLIYPDENFKLFQIYIDGFRFINESKQIEKLKGVVDAFPFNNYYLLAVDNKNESIKFISGQFFKNNIVADFSINKKKTDSFLQYILYRTYCLKTKDIVFKKKRGKRLYFKAYSELINRDIEIMLSLDNIENPKIIH